MDRYGLASGKNFNYTIADRNLDATFMAFRVALDLACSFAPSVGYRRITERDVKDATIRLVRAGRDVERQRSFERGIEAFAAMPFKADIVSAPEQVRPNRWTPGTYCGE